MNTVFLGLLLGLASAPAVMAEAEPSSPATLHVWRDADGATHYSDTPRDPAAPAATTRPPVSGSMTLYAPAPLTLPTPAKKHRISGPLKPRDLRVGDGPSFIPRMDARCEWLSGRIGSLKKLIDDGGRGADSIWQEEYGRRCGEWPKTCSQYPQQRPSCAGAKSPKRKSR